MKILFVCKGNICRSPMAEGIMRTLVSDINANIIVDSAGTHDFNAGNPPDSRAYLTCMSYGIDVSNQTAHKITKKDADESDYIFVMDFENMEELKKQQLYNNKIKSIANYIYSRNIDEIPDPYNHEDEYFHEIYALLYEACTNILNEFCYEMG